MLSSIFSYVEYYYKGCQSKMCPDNTFKKPDGYKNINSSSMRY